MEYSVAYTENSNLIIQYNKEVIKNADVINCYNVRQATVIIKHELLLTCRIFKLVSPSRLDVSMYDMPCGSLQQITVLDVQANRTKKQHKATSIISISFQLHANLRLTKQVDCRHCGS